MKSPIVEVLKTDWRNIVKGIGLRIAETAGYAVSVTYMISYLNSQHLADKTQTLVALCIASAIGIFATQAWARLTDRIGRRPLYIWSCAFAVLFAIPMFLLVNTGLFIFVIATIGALLRGLPELARRRPGCWFPELFQAKTRASGASLAYQISAMVSGFTPFITTLLFVSFGWMGPALLFGAYAAIGLWAAGHPRNVGQARTPAGRRSHQKHSPVGERLMTVDPGTQARHAQDEPGRTRPRRRHANASSGSAAAYRIRHHALNMGEVQGQGYVGQALGAADMLAAVYADQLRFRAEDPEWEGRDRFLLSTGHYAIGHYAALAEAGIVPVEELETLRLGRFPAPDVRDVHLHAGHGDLRRFARPRPHHRGRHGPGPPAPCSRAPAARVYNFLSDGELDEGSTWEAAMGAHHHQLGNLTAMVDINALQADGKTDTVLRTEPVTEKWEVLRLVHPAGGRERRRCAAGGVRQRSRPGRRRRASFRDPVRHEGGARRAAARGARKGALHAHRRTRMAALPRAADRRIPTGRPADEHRHRFEGQQRRPS